jgi:plastocyanin
MRTAIAVGFGVAAAAAPGLAAGSAPTSATFAAYDYGWIANGKAKSTRAVIAPGGTVSFSYPAGRSEHNADFRGGPSPTSCTQTGGLTSGSVPPLPHVPTGQGWTGSCRFARAGVYQFHCDVHPFMTGTIVAVASGSPLAGNPRRDVSVASRQRGTSVRGSVRLSGAAAGGRLEVDLRASGRSVGHLVRTDLQPGTMRFSLSLDRGAKRALRRAGHIGIAVKVTVRSLNGAEQSLLEKVLLSSA